MKDTIIQNWNDIMQLLETQYDISDIIVKTWIETLTLDRVEDKTAYFYVDEKKGTHGVEYLRNKGYDVFLLSAIRECLNDAEIDIVIDTYDNIVNLDSMDRVILIRSFYMVKAELERLT